MPFYVLEAMYLAPSHDERVVARQLRRRPKPFLDVCRRCRYDYPQVIANNPVHSHPSGFEVFPTVYWLTCPLLARAISRLEAEGQIRMYEERLRTDGEFLDRMESEHRAAAASRLKLVPEEVQEALQSQQPRQWESLAETGIAGIRAAEGVKCLHAHFADYVGRGTNPIGQDVAEQLRSRGVAVDGDDDCWRHCTVDVGRGPEGIAKMQTIAPDPVSISGRSGSTVEGRARRNGVRPSGEGPIRARDAEGDRRVGVIDIGTNSVRLLVADVADGAVRPVLQAMHMPRIGEGVDRSGRLHSAAMERAAAAVGDLRRRAEEAGVGSFVVVGTSALRDASNRQLFVDLVREEHGLDVVVLSGEEEAAASFRGAVLGLASHHFADSEIVSVLDVGGGSTELTTGTSSGRMLERVSVDVGAVRMTEACISSDPPSDLDWRRLSEAVERGLRPFWSQGTEGARHRAADPANPPTLIALGGTATTLAAVDLGHPEYDSRRVHGHRLSAAAVGSLLERMRRSTAEERARLPAMQPERADIIVAGAFIVDRVLRGLGTDGIIVSEADLLVGLLLHR